MRNLLFFILIISSSAICGQDLAIINNNFGLKDSLNNNLEIRIYRNIAVANSTSVFRMYETESGIWKAEYHYQNHKNSKSKKVENISKKLEPKNDFELVWLNMLKSNITDLPEMSEILWKLKKEPEIVEFNGRKELMWKKSDILDGISYLVQIRTNDTRKQVDYWNPESYLSIYPDIDELIYFNQLLDVIKTEFDMWNNN